MALRQEYALGHSRFNDFLFALVGEEKSGQELTVLSVLSRLGLNPWEEAARLSNLSKDAAAQALAAIFARMPEDEWQQPGLKSIAGRLVDYLPDPASNPKHTDYGGAETERPTTGANVRKMIFWACLAAAITVAVISRFS